MNPSQYADFLPEVGAPITNAADRIRKLRNDAQLAFNQAQQDIGRAETALLDEITDLWSGRDINAAIAQATQEQRT